VELQNTDDADVCHSTGGTKVFQVKETLEHSFTFFPLFLLLAPFSQLERPQMQ